MKDWKKIIRTSAFALLIVIAGIGIGLVGPIPIPSNKRKNTQEFPIELIESEKHTDEVKPSKVKT